RTALMTPSARRRRTRSWQEDVGRPTRAASSLLVIEASCWSSRKMRQSTGSRVLSRGMCRMLSGLACSILDDQRSWRRASTLCPRARPVRSALADRERRRRPRRVRGRRGRCDPRARPDRCIRRPVGRYRGGRRARPGRPARRAGGPAPGSAGGRGHRARLLRPRPGLTHVRRLHRGGGPHADGRDRAARRRAPRIRKRGSQADPPPAPAHRPRARTGPVTLERWTAFLGVLLVVVLTPGPDFAVVLRHSLAGPARGVRAAAGITTGLACHTTAAALGLSAALAARPDVLTAIRLAGAAYLGWLAVQALRAAFAREPAAAHQRGARSAHPYLDGLATNLFNPKALLFFLGLIPQFVVPGPTVTAQLL